MAAAFKHGISMKIRNPRLTYLARLIACLLAIPVLMSGCALYQNSSACEQHLRTMAAQKFPAGKLSILHTGMGIHGTRVVVEGEIDSTRAAASAALAAPALTDESVSLALASSVVPASASAFAFANASQPVQASALAKPKKIRTPVAAECVFKAKALTSFDWLAPSAWVTPSDSGG
jgi:hypothetical protein